MKDWKFVEVVSSLTIQEFATIRNNHADDSKRRGKLLTDKQIWQIIERRKELKAEEKV